MQPPGFRWIESASRLVPRRRRGAWRREWEAEVSYAWKRMLDRGRNSFLDRVRLRVRVFACWIDAFMEMKEDWRMTGLLNDLRFAFRGLVKNPAFSIVAVITLALGIGSTTSVFTFVDGVLIRPLPFSESQELVSIQHQGREGRDALPISPGLYLLYKEQASSLGEIAMSYPTAVNLLVGAEPERASIRVVTPGFFEVLRVSPVVGRAFLPEEELPGSEPVAVISDALWQESFGGDPSVVGQVLDVNGTNRRIVGIMPPDFGFPDRRARAWVPYEVDPAQAPLASFGASGIARLAPGNTVESVHAELQGLISRLSELFPESTAPAFLEEVNLRARIEPLKETLVGDVSTTLWILLGTVGFVLLIACANVANLLLVRAETRQRELALRLAIGASRREIVRFFMGESLVLAAVGGALGVAVSSWALSLSTSFVPANLPRIAEVGMDPRILGFAAVVTLGCAIFFGLFPLVRYGAEDLTNQLKDGGGRGATGGRDRHRLRNGLVVVQVALALVLLVGAGLMFRSFQALRSQEPGFEVEEVLSARVTIPVAEAPEWQDAAGFFRQLRERMLGQPGVLSVGWAQSAPLAGGVAYVTVGVEDHPRGPEEMPIFCSQMSAGEGYFETMGIELQEGRTFRTGDGAEGTRAVLVSESFADHWWPETSPLGRRIGNGGPDGTDWWEIVGVVGDVTHQSLQADPEEFVYFPVTRGPAASPGSVRSMDILIKTSGDPLQMIPVLRRELQDLNPRIPLSNPRTMEEVFRLATAPMSVTMTMLGAASFIALLLGLIGIYGVISYVVSQRTREIGVRMALGATAPAVRGMVVKQGLVLAVGGVILGLIAAGVLSSLMASLLFGVGALDPLTYASVSVALVVVAAFASWLPARRAAGVDPSRALRED